MSSSMPSLDEECNCKKLPCICLTGLNPPPLQRQIALEKHKLKTENLTSLNLVISNSDLSEIQNRARDRCLEKFYTTLFTQILYNDPQQFGNHQLQLDVQKLKEYEGKGTPWGYLITISPLDIKRTPFKELLSKIISKKWFIHYCYCIEKESKYHSHIYVRSCGKIFSEVKREIKNTCKLIKCNIDFKRIKQQDEVNCINYCIGKSSKDKHPPLFVFSTFDKPDIT